MKRSLAVDIASRMIPPHGWTVIVIRSANNHFEYMQYTTAWKVSVGDTIRSISNGVTTTYTISDIPKRKVSVGDTISSISTGVTTTYTVCNTPKRKEIL